MDGTREADLYQLDSERKDTSRPLWEQRRAARQFAKIQAQIQDRKLVRMRFRLLKAHKAKDRQEIWKITNQIKDYQKQPIIPMEDMV